MCYYCIFKNNFVYISKFKAKTLREVVYVPDIMFPSVQRTASDNEKKSWYIDCFPGQKDRNRKCNNLHVQIMFHNRKDYWSVNQVVFLILIIFQTVTLFADFLSVL